MKDKVMKIGNDMYIGAKQTLNVLYLLCAVYGAYQIITKLDKLGQVLEIAQK